MHKPIRILIIGGGISGLTLANLLIHNERKNKYQVTLFETHVKSLETKDSIGGGIGL